MRPFLHPSARLLGAAPRRDGLWVGLWATADGVVCTTLGRAPGDGSTATRSARHADAHAARVAIRERLSELWSAYLAEGPVAHDRLERRPPVRRAREAPIAFTSPAERPVGPEVARRAARRGRILRAA
jgi:hypothetical protein